MNNREKTIREEAMRRSQHWWFCDNILHHANQVGLLRMDFPQVFILIRDYDEAYFATFEQFKSNIAEVNFFTPSERANADVEQILIDAWNFLSLTEEEEERQAELADMDDDDF